MKITGRAAECARIDRLLADARNGRSGSLLLRGEPGIGKSALVAYALGRAGEMDTLRAVGVEAEQDLPFAALQGLLRGHVDLLELIPQPQALALRAALSLGPSVDGDRLAANAGTLSLLAEAAEQRPVLVVVDDAQWLDRASGEALLFAARRVAAEAIALLFAVSTDGGTRFEAEGLSELVVEGLDDESALALVQAQSPRLAPAVAERLVRETGGNPLALVELPSLLSEAQLTGEEPIEQPLPIGRKIGQAFLLRVRGLEPETQQALLVAAAGEGAGMEAVVGAAGLLGCGPRALDAAEAAGLVLLSGGALGFRHPLVRAAVYHAAAPAERRAAHRALAAVLVGDRRAWQLAAAAEGLDEEAAVALEQAAALAGARGSHALQLRALERAVELSAGGVSRTTRMLLASRAASRAGEPARAMRLAEEALPLAEEPLLHADLLHQQAAIARSQGLPFREATIAAEAHSVALLDAERAAGLLGLILERRLAALETAAALELAEQRAAMCATQGREWRLRTLGDLLCARAMRGDSEAALELLPELLGDVDRAAEQAPSLIWLERYDEARRTLGASLEQARARSRTSAIAWTQACLAILELRAGRLAVTLAAASESALLADQLGAEDLLAFNQPALAYVAAVQGRGDACREHAAIAERLGARRQNEHVRAGARIALGLLALGDGLPHETIAQLEPVARLAERGAVGEPSVLPFAPDLIEAYVRAGDVAAARAELETFASRAGACRRGWALAAAARCAGLLADEHDIDARFGEALDLGEHAASPLEQARTRLCLGERLRRANRRREARGHLRAALDSFDDAGAGPWSERARAELRATGETVARRDASAPERLTAQELQIALLVADSKSNRDVAGAMFISRKTVEYHLAHIYRKLDIHSRGELTRLFAENAASSARARD